MRNMKNIKEKCRPSSGNLLNGTKPANAMCRPININVRNYLNKGNFMWFHALRCIKPLSLFEAGVIGLVLQIRPLRLRKTE